LPCDPVAKFDPKTEMIDPGAKPPVVLEASRVDRNRPIRTEGGGTEAVLTPPINVWVMVGSGNCVPEMVTFVGFAVEGFQVPE